MSRFELIAATPVARAVAPLRAVAMDSADAAMIAKITRVLSELERVSWDLAVYAPCPHSHMSTESYRQASAKRNFAKMITRGVKHTLRPNDPEIVQRDEQGITRAIKACRAMAAETYDAYVWKLCGKIGDCLSATLSSNNGLWLDSTLTVTKATGAENWRTQMILNHSVYGLPFNQFPTRRIP